MPTTPVKDNPELFDVDAGETITFDNQRQAWFPGDGELSERFTARAVLKKKCRFEAAVGMRSREIQFEVTEEYKPDPEE